MMQQNEEVRVDRRDHRSICPVQKGGCVVAYGTFFTMAFHRFTRTPLMLTNVNFSTNHYDKQAKYFLVFVTTATFVSFSVEAAKTSRKFSIKRVKF